MNDFKRLADCIYSILDTNKSEPLTAEQCKALDEVQHILTTLAQATAEESEYRNRDAYVLYVQRNMYRNKAERLEKENEQLKQQLAEAHQLLKEIDVTIDDTGVIVVRPYSDEWEWSRKRDAAIAQHGEV